MPNNLDSYEAIASLLSGLVHPTPNNTLTGEFHGLYSALLAKDGVDGELFRPLGGASSVLHLVTSGECHTPFRYSAEHNHESYGLLSVWDDIHNRFLRRPAASIVESLRDVLAVGAENIERENIVRLLDGLEHVKGITPANNNLAQNPTQPAHNATHASLIKHYTNTGLASDDARHLANLVCFIVDAESSAKSQLTPLRGGTRDIYQQKYLISAYGGAGKAATSTAELFRRVSDFTGLDLDTQSKLYTMENLHDLLNTTSRRDGMSHAGRISLAYALHDFALGEPPSTYPSLHSLLRIAGHSPEWLQTANAFDHAEQAGWSAATVPLLLNTSARWLDKTLESGKPLPEYDTPRIAVFLNAAEYSLRHGYENIPDVDALISYTQQLYSRLEPGKALDNETRATLEAYTSAFGALIEQAPEASPPLLNRALVDAAHQFSTRGHHAATATDNSLIQNLWRLWQRGRSLLGGDSSPNNCE